MANLVEKWAPVLEDESFAPIQNLERKKVVAQLIENQIVEHHKYHKQ